MEKKNSRKNPQKTITIVFLAMLAVIAVLIIAIWLLFQKYMNMIDFDHKEDTSANVQVESVLTDDEIMEESLQTDDYVV